VTPADALSAVLCTLTQHVSGGETRHLLEALPPDVAARLTLERCVRHRDLATARFGREAMLRRVGEHLEVSRGDAEDITSAVMMAIGLRVRVEAIPELADRLPMDLRELWVVHRVAAPADPHPVFSIIESEVGLPYGLTGMAAFTAVMSVLSRTLSRADAQSLHAALAPDLKPLLAESRAGRGDTPEGFGRDELLARVATHLEVTDAEPVVRAVFRAVQVYLRTDVVARVAAELPRGLQELWIIP
jgi:uncharacterized protein (DUF2267 family)